MTVYYFIEYRPGERGDEAVAIHAVKVPSLIDKDGYRQGTSAEAFSRYEREKVWDTKKGGWARKPYTRRFSQRFSDDLKFDLCLAKRLGAKIEPLATARVVRHRSIWAFYTAIGYNYKKKRYD